MRHLMTLFSVLLLIGPIAAEADWTREVLDNGLKVML